MIIVTQIKKLAPEFNRTAIALGTFDGVHLGHQRIIRRVVELARNLDGTSVVFTFSNHPLSVIDPERCPPQITGPEHKARLIEKLGVDVLLTIPFTPEFLRMSPMEFFTLMVKNLNPAAIVVGPNYSFGYRGEGTPSLLKQMGVQHSVATEIQEGVRVDGAIVSSTAIRNLIAEGNVSQAIVLLGRPFTIRGKVIRGDGRGRMLGYPTANLAVSPEFVTPGDGVYAVRVMAGGKNYGAVANVGTNPTFNGSERRIEVFVLDFEGDLYNQFITVYFLEKIREEKSFSGVAELKNQIFLDIAVAQKIL